MYSKKIFTAVSICSISDFTHNLKGPDLVKKQKILARLLLKKEFLLQGLTPPDLFPQAESGQPLPYKGVYWSISHKTSCVAAMISSVACGVDIEIVTPRKSELLEYVAPLEEWELAGFSSKSFKSPDSEVWNCFYRFWTAREALLKCIGVGLALLSKCSVIKILNSQNISMSLDKNEAEKLGCSGFWQIHQASFYHRQDQKNIIVSYTSAAENPQNGISIKFDKKNWDFLDN